MKQPCCPDAGEWNCHGQETGEVFEAVERLLKRAMTQAVAKEREICAQIADADLKERFGEIVAAQMRFDGGASERAAMRIAAAIRARGSK